MKSIFNTLYLFVVILFIGSCLYTHAGKTQTTKVQYEPVDTSSYYNSVDVSKPRAKNISVYSDPDLDQEYKESSYAGEEEDTTMYKQMRMIENSNGTGVDTKWYNKQDGN